MHVESVSEAIAETLWSGYGKTIYMPGIMRYIAILVSAVAALIEATLTPGKQKGGPEWLWRVARKGTGNTKVDFKGRQKLDPKTGALLQS